MTTSECRLQCQDPNHISCLESIPFSRAMYADMNEKESPMEDDGWSLTLPSGKMIPQFSNDRLESFSLQALQSDTDLCSVSTSRAFVRSVY